LRDGRLVDTCPIADVTQADLIRKMVGREIADPSGAAKAEVAAGGEAPSPATPSSGEAVLEVRGLTRAGAFANVSFEVRAGEIVGMAGLVGAGRSEVARAMFGVDRFDTGSVTVSGKTLAPGSVRDAITAGVALVPEDRQHLGLVLPLGVGENLTLAVLRALATGNGLVRDKRRESDVAMELIGDLDVRGAPNLAAAAENLSGGNQQKLVLGKWLAAAPRVLILDEPTRGVDVGAKAAIYALIRKLAQDGMATLLISSDLPEVLALSDRVLVMRAGRIAGEFARPRPRRSAFWPSRSAQRRQGKGSRHERGADRDSANGGLGEPTGPAARGRRWPAARPDDRRCDPRKSRLFVGRQRARRARSGRPDPDRCLRADLRGRDRRD
jgi:rhamnose transport system ATP-binding protein